MKKRKMRAARVKPREPQLVTAEPQVHQRRRWTYHPIQGWKRPAEILRLGEQLVKEHVIAISINAQSLKSWRKTGVTNSHGLPYPLPADSPEVRAVKDSAIYSNRAALLVLFWYSARQVGESEEEYRSKMAKYLQDHPDYESN